MRYEDDTFDGVLCEVTIRTHMHKTTPSALIDCVGITLAISVRLLLWFMEPSR